MSIDPRRGKGKRGGLRVIYYLWTGGSQFWLRAEANAQARLLIRLAAEYPDTLERLAQI